MSHAAIVAREFGVPTVVGTRWATHVIRDGDTIEVNGDEGLVRLAEGTDRRLSRDASSSRGGVK